MVIVAQMDTIQWNEDMREHTRSTLIGEMSLEAGEFLFLACLSSPQHAYSFDKRLYRENQ